MDVQRAFLLGPLLIAAWLVYRLALLIYSAYSGPLASLPVPHWSCRFSLAWYALHGQAKSRIPYELLELHRKSGSKLVRWGPRHVSIQSYEAYRQVYLPPQQTFRKDRDYYQSFTTAPQLWNVFTASDPAVHRARRGALSPLFSRRSLLTTEPLLKDKARIVTDRLVERSNSGHPSNLLYAFRCMTVDVISAHHHGDFMDQQLIIPTAVLAWGKSLDTLGANGVPDFKISLLKALDNQAPALHLRQVIPGFFHWLGAHMPLSMLPPDVKDFLSLASQAEQVCAEHRARGKSDSPYIVLFDLLSSTKKENPITDELAVAEAIDILIAGLDTTGHTIACTTFALTVANADAGRRLVAELRQAFPNGIEDWDACTLTQLEDLAYLNACVKEGLRWADAGNGLLPRVVPVEGVVLDNMALPGGTIVAASSIYTHHDETIFPRATEYRPERWLDRDGKFSNALDTYMLQFSKGPRACIGKDLAYAELLVALSHLFLRCDVTTAPDTPARLTFVENFTGGVLGHDLVMHVRERA